jgi:hypothetical protein
MIRTSARIHVASKVRECGDPGGDLLSAVFVAVGMVSPDVNSLTQL